VANLELFWASLNHRGGIHRSVGEPVKDPTLKNPDIPELECYEGRFPENFWLSFPYNPLRGIPRSNIDVKMLGALLSERSPYLRGCEIARGKKVIAYVTDGAPSHQSYCLPPVHCRNASTAYENGRFLTDTIAEWLKAGFVAGPFNSPPVNRFRVNSIMVAVQPGKIRPILNVSTPEGNAFNDAVSDTGPEKVYMSSPRRFSQSILCAGAGAIMSKFDMKDAYKNIPCMPKDYRLQGFEWGGEIFCGNHPNIWGKNCSLQL
jgi:hypothetical protein